MRESGKGRKKSVHCPTCNSLATYRYGKPGGKQRYFCLICERQFTLNKKRIELLQRPNCGKCGSEMNVYRRDDLVVRFRCSKSPECNEYMRISACEFEKKYSSRLNRQKKPENCGVLK